VDRFDGFFIHAVQRRKIVVELIGRFVNEVKSQHGRALAKIVRHGNPPVDHLFLVIGFRVVFIFISLIGDNRNHAVLLAGFHQLTQVDQPSFRRLIRHANTHMADPFRVKIADHQRVELADAALGARPVHVDTHAKLLRIAGSRQRRLSGTGQAGSDHKRSGNNKL